MAAENNASKHGPDIAAAVKDALLSGLVALALFGPLIGLRTEQNMRNELVVQSRWGLLATIIAIIVIGRFLIMTLVSPALARRSQRASARPDHHPSALRQAFGRWFAPAIPAS
jgi:branched-chain amino acid transport system permease protein